MKKHKATYQCWQDMRQRCTNERHHQYPNYGARGIAIFEEWCASYESFLRDMGEKPDGLTLDRIDNDKGYAKQNCRWATRVEQNRNTRNVRLLEMDGVTKTTREWAREYGLNELTLRRRVVEQGLSVKEALTKPVNKDRSKGGSMACVARWGIAEIAKKGQNGSPE